MSKRVLYIGMDESNHGELKSRIGEIIVASFTYSKKFWDETKKHPNRRDFSQIEYALKNGVDYFYTLLPHEIAKRNYSNLPLVAPELLERILYSKYAPEINIGLDGRLLMRDKKKMLKIFEGWGFEPNISNYIKENGVHRGPKLIYISHLIANSLFRRSMLDIANDPHYTPFDVL